MFLLVVIYSYTGIKKFSYKIFHFTVPSLCFPPGSFNILNGIFIFILRTCRPVAFIDGINNFTVVLIFLYFFFCPAPVIVICKAKKNEVDENYHRSEKNGEEDRGEPRRPVVALVFPVQAHTENRSEGFML